MAQQAIPDEFVHKNGRTVKLYVHTNGDTVVRQFEDGSPKRYEGFSFQPHGIERYHALRRESGLPCADYTAPKRVPVPTVKECAEDEHDWDWLNPDDAEDRQIVCSKCKKIDTDDSEEE